MVQVDLAEFMPHLAIQLLHQVQFLEFQQVAVAVVLRVALQTMQLRRLAAEDLLAVEAVLHF
jgi:hypothetical protein